MRERKVNPEGKSDLQLLSEAILNSKNRLPKPRKVIKPLTQASLLKAPADETLAEARRSLGLDLQGHYVPTAVRLVEYPEGIVELTFVYRKE